MELTVESSTSDTDHLRTRLRVHRGSRAVWLTLDGEAVRNALDSGVYLELIEQLEHADRDPDVRAVVITGAGSAFCAGMNLKAPRAWAGSDEERAAPRALHRLRTLGKPSIAAVNGSAVGAGVGLVLCCDVAVASSTARFSVPEARLGVPPTMVAPALVHAVGPREAKRRLLIGDTFDAEEARNIGIIHEIAPPGAVSEVVDRYLDHIEAADPATLEATKAMLDGRTGPVPNQDPTGGGSACCGRPSPGPTGGVEAARVDRFAIGVNE